MITFMHPAQDSEGWQNKQRKYNIGNVWQGKKKSSGLCHNLKKASLKALAYIDAFLKYVRSNPERFN